MPNIQEQLSNIRNNTFGEKEAIFTQLRSEEVIALAEALKTNTSITSLKLNHCVIDTSGAQAIASLLAESTHLKSLHLHDIQFGDNDITVIITALHRNNIVSVLSLQACKINNTSAAALSMLIRSNKNLSELDLARNHDITTQGIKSITQELRSSSIKTLNLSEIKIDTEGNLAIMLAKNLKSDIKIITSEEKKPTENARLNTRSTFLLPNSASFTAFPSSHRTASQIPIVGPTETQDSNAFTNISRVKIENSLTTISNSTKNGSKLDNASAENTTQMNKTNAQIVVSSSSNSKTTTEPGKPRPKIATGTKAIVPSSTESTVPRSRVHDAPGSNSPENSITISTAAYQTLCGPGGALGSIIQSLDIFITEKELTSEQIHVINLLKSHLMNLNIQDALDLIKNELSKKGNPIFRSSLFSSKALKPILLQAENKLLTIFPLERIIRRCEDYYDSKKSSNKELIVMKRRAVKELKQEITKDPAKAYCYVSSWLRDPKSRIFQCFFSSDVKILFDDARDALELATAQLKS